MRSHVRTAPFVESAVSFDCFQLLVARKRNAVQGRHFIKRPSLRAFHARAVVPKDIKNERIIGETHILNRLHNASHGMVGVFLVTGIDFHLTRIHFFYFRRYAVPGWEHRITRSKLGSRRNNAELLLPCERLLAQLVPALIEFALVFVAPFIRHLVWCMSCTSREIEKERFIRCLRFLVANPSDRVIDHGVVEIKILLFRHADNLVVFSKERIELTVFSAEKSPEIIEAERVRPSIERARRPLLRIRCKMPLADGRSVITVGLKNLRDGRGARRPVRAVARPTTDQLGDRAESHRMMIPTRKQGRGRRRTKRSHVKSTVTESLRRQFVQRGRSDGATEGGRITETGIVNQHEKNVRRIRRSFYWLGKGPLRSFQRAFGDALERFSWTRQHSSIPFRIRYKRSEHLRCDYKCSHCYA